MSKKIKDTLNNVKQSKSRIIWILILSIFGMVIILSFFYIRYIKSFTYKSIYNNITELSEQTASQLNLAITNQKQLLEIMIDSINSGFYETENDIFKHFEKELENYHFTRFVILDEHGNGQTSDGYMVENYPNIEEFFGHNEGVYLSENRPSTVSNNQVNIYSKTFMFKEQKRVLFATINTENYKEILLRRLFNGNGGTYLINYDGSILIDSFGKIKENNVNLFDYLKTEYQLKQSKDLRNIDAMQKNIVNNKVGTFDIRFDKKVYFIHYERVNVNDWYVVTIAPDDIIAKELPLFLGTSLGLCFVMIIVIVIIFIYIYIFNQRQSEKLYHIAYIDSITGLGNETYFREKGSDFLKTTAKNKYAITLDIDKFKALNNIYNYKFCNQILREMSKRIIQVLPEDAVICRISNDIFAIVCSYNKNIKELLEKIFEVSSELKVDNHEIYINISIGVYKIGINEYDISRILDKASIARSKVKGLYDSHYYIFDNNLEQLLIEEQKIESSMEEALKNQEFKIIYQPKIYTKDETLAGAEALVRWHKGSTIIPPSQFIPLFEKNKFILKLDLYIFEQVCKDIASWNSLYDKVPVISVNVSKVHFANENFIDNYVKIADKYHIDRSKIDLEITESATIDSNIDIMKILINIKEKGFIISIDDFGTGYSSLSLLQNMPIDILKIDKAFIKKSDLNSNNNMIDYITLIAKRIGVKTIVEGIETKEQVEFIKKIECDMIQGYYYSKPIDKNEFENYLKNGK